jgi:hypothetical protein
MGIWVGIVVLVLALGVGVVALVARGGTAGRIARREWRQLKRTGRRELRQFRRQRGIGVNWAAIAERRHEAPPDPFSGPGF